MDSLAAKLDKGFLKKIVEDPDDDVARLVYADFLDEQGYDDEACAQRLAVALKTVIATPADDAPRLAYAAVCEQYRRVERAELIRVQCELAKTPEYLDLGIGKISAGRFKGGTGKVQIGNPRYAALRRRERELLERHRQEWTNLVPGFVLDAWSLDEPIQSYVYGGRVLFRRGFVAEVRQRQVDFVGQECPDCRGAGWRGAGRTCDPCHGTGRTGAHGPAIVRAALLERVVMTDKHPLREIDWNGNTLGWFWAAAEETDIPWRLPECIARRLRPKPSLLLYATEQKALEAASNACLDWAKDQL